MYLGDMNLFLNAKQRLASIKPQTAMVVLGLCFFIVYSYLYATSGMIFNSPDETANFVFAQQFAGTGSFTIPFDAQANSGDIVHPRSVNILNSAFVPGSFLGLPFLLALFERIYPGLSLLIPSLLAVAGVLAYWGIIKRVFSSRIAFVSALLLYSLPQWWHFAAKGFLPNTAFLSLLLIGGYLLLKAHEVTISSKQQVGLSLLSGVTIAYALFIRPSEVVWVGPIFLILFIVYRKSLNLKNFLFIVIGGVIVGGGAVHLHQITFGGALNTGYTQYSSGSQFVEQGIGSKLLFLLFPFGVDSLQAIVNTFVYSFKLFWWQFLLISVGVVAFLNSSSTKRDHLVYVSILGGLIIYLGLYYGSWGISDDLDSHRISIGMSYVRYWLPLYLGLLPFMVFGIQAIVRRLLSEKREVVGILIAVTIVSVSHVFYVYLAKDNLREIKENVVNYNHTRQQIEEITNPDSVIISERNDKVFWPSRDVIHYQDQNFAFLKFVPDLLNARPVYWATILPRDHVLIWQETVFFQQGLTLEYIQGLKGGGVLYQVIYDQNITL
jgi:hypothetical protein